MDDQERPDSDSDSSLSQMQVFALQGIGLEREVYVGAQVAFQSSLTLLAVLHPVRPIPIKPANVSAWLYPEFQWSPTLLVFGTLESRPH